MYLHRIATTERLFIQMYFPLKIKKYIYSMGKMSLLSNYFIFLVCQELFSNDSSSRLLGEMLMSVPGLLEQSMTSWVA
jgi:hypothetical protein